MTKPIIIIHNTETSEVIEREMTNEEFAQYEIDEAKTKADANAHQIKEQAKLAAQSKLAALGLTVEDLTALGL